MGIQITTLIDNYASKASLAEWGLSFHINIDGFELLFDTGLTGDHALQNAEELELDLSNTKHLIISHGHYDHLGGVDKFITSTNIKTIFCSNTTFNERFTVKNGKSTLSGYSSDKNLLLKNSELELTHVDRTLKINGQIYIVGNTPLKSSFEKISSNFKINSINGEFLQDLFEDELTLVIKSIQGLIVVTGCAHRGIVNILEDAKSIFSSPIFAIVGGFHLYNAKEDQINCVFDYFEKEKIEIIAPSHCTGLDNIYKLKKLFGSHVQPMYSGDKLTI